MNYDEGKYGPIRNWSRGCFLKSGGMGEMFIGKNMDNGQLFLIKSVSREPVWNKQLTALKNEEEILQKLTSKNCPNIFRTIGNATSESVAELGGKPTMDLFLEFAIPRGNLTEIIRSSHKLKESVAKAYTFQILQALSCMHKNGIVHRSIKGTNIIVCEKVVKLTGLGLAKDFSHHLERRNICPECKEDIFALGMVVCEMITGHRPKLDFASPKKEAIKSLQSDLAKEGMTTCMDFIEACFNENTSINVDQLLAHPWIESVDGYSPSTLLPVDEAATGSHTYRDKVPELCLKTDAITQTTAISPRVMSLRKCADKLCCRRMDVDNVIIPPLRSNSSNMHEYRPRKGAKLSRVLSLA